MATQKMTKTWLVLTSGYQCMMRFQIHSSFCPSGDQPQAIEGIVRSFLEGGKIISLLGATGTGKTFTMANVIERLQKPTLILSHNKTLAAQLATEFKYFFPKNAVHYFVSYFDYYQPESYLPDRGVYIEKEATINKKIEMYRLATLASLLSRKDVIVVASVSALYGLGRRSSFAQHRFVFEVGKEYSFDEIKTHLITMQYRPAVNTSIDAGTFDIQGELIDIASSTERVIYRLFFDDKKLEHIQKRDLLTLRDLGSCSSCVIWPATQFLQDLNNKSVILEKIKQEALERERYFREQGKHEEASRIKKRVAYDIKMIEETGFVNGIENYSPYFEERLDGSPPHTLFDYFPDDFLCIVDESHMTIPQLIAMPRADSSRKETLIEHGFRLPSAKHHRPLSFDELCIKLGWNDDYETGNNVAIVNKCNTKTLFVSATPASFEIQHSDHIVQQIIRPTGLLDPITFVYPKSGDYNVLLKSIENLRRKDAGIMSLLQGYRDEYQYKDVEDYTRV